MQNSRLENQNEDRARDWLQMCAGDRNKEDQRQKKTGRQKSSRRNCARWSRSLTRGPMLAQNPTGKPTRKRNRWKRTSLMEFRPDPDSNESTNTRWTCESRREMNREQGAILAREEKSDRGTRPSSARSYLEIQDARASRTSKPNKNRHALRAGQETEQPEKKSAVESFTEKRVGTLCA
jgi:hypothetical protein